MKKYAKFPTEIAYKLRIHARKLHDNLPKPVNLAMTILYRDVNRNLLLRGEKAKFRKAWRSVNEKIEDINAFENRIYSQNGEDGIIKAIFKKIGTGNKFFVEFGVGNGTQCNTRYLLEKEGWTGLQMDCADNNPPRIKKESINAENINQLFKKYGVPKEFDLLSIDIDYNSYWVWKAIKVYSPRVIVIEYNSDIPPNESKAVKYDPRAMWDGSVYFGASLLAMVKYGKSIGYTLIGCDNRGVNAFFVKTSLVGDNFAVKSVEKFYKPPIHYGKQIGHPPSPKKFISV